MPTPSHPCVVLVPSGAVVDRRFEEALMELNRRGYPVRRVRQPDPPPGFRDQLASDVLATGFSELLWLDPSVVFDPSDVERLRAATLPMVCGIYPWPGRQGLVCEFTPETTSVKFGRSGGQLSVVSCGLGFALIRRTVFESIARQSPSCPRVSYFAAPATGDPLTIRAAEDVAFCERVRAAGLEVVTDTSIRLWRVGPTKLGWEDAGWERERHGDLTLLVRSQTLQKAHTPKPDDSKPSLEPNRSALRPPATPLHESFPRIGMYVVTYLANAASLEPTLASIRESDWGQEPVVVMQPTDWPVSRDNGSRNYKRALEAAAADGCDFALILEDDVLVNRHLRHNILTNPLVRRDQCDYFSLFLPDLIAEPWERLEPHLGYRLAHPRYSGPNQLWERSRVYGSQGLVLSQRFMLAALQRWDRLVEGQDTRVISVCAEFRLPLWYSVPSLVEHVPRVSAFGTPLAYAPDYDETFRLELKAGFQPPEEVPGWLTLPEATLLWRTAAGLEVLELGTACGRSTVCLGQSAKRVVSVDVADQSEAKEWVRRFGVADRVEFIRCDAGEVCQQLSGKFGLAFIDTTYDAASVERDIACALQVLAPGGLLVFHGYPDPARPDVRRVVDANAKHLRWKRITQADFLGVFRTDGAVGMDCRAEVYRDLHDGQLAREEGRNRVSARRILHLLFNYARPNSVLDVGCGLGTWLHVALELGVKVVQGIEGMWLDRSLLQIDPVLITALDLEHGFDLNRRFDLAICLEVAEHLPPSAAGTLVGSLAAHSDLVLFSAAIPHQGGHHHVNEQFPTYWVRRFAEHGFTPVDMIRPRIWDEPNVHWWLRQNTLLFAHDRVLTTNPALGAERAVERPLDVVHPEVYLARIRNAKRTGD